MNSKLWLTGVRAISCMCAEHMRQQCTQMLPIGKLCADTRTQALLDKSIQSCVIILVSQPAAELLVAVATAVGYSLCIQLRPHTLRTANLQHQQCYIFTLGILLLTRNTAQHAGQAPCHSSTILKRLSS